MCFPPCFKSVFGVPLRTIMLWITTMLILLEVLLIPLIYLGYKENIIGIINASVIDILCFVVVLLLVLKNDRAPLWAHLVCLAVWWVTTCLLLTSTVAIFYPEQISHVRKRIFNATWVAVSNVVIVIDFVFLVFGGFVYYCYYKEITLAHSN